MNDDIGQDVCPWNVKFASALPDESPCCPRAAIAGKDARPLAHELSGVSQEELGWTFKSSPMKRQAPGPRTKRGGVLGRVGRADDVPSLVAASSGPEPLVRGHAAWALGKIGSPEALAALRARAPVESHGSPIEGPGPALGPAGD